VLFDVYEIIFDPEIIFPNSGNPIVESTVIVLDPTATSSSVLEYPGTVKVPWIASLSVNPTKRPNL
jgi:hypothetical protein